LNQQRLPHGLNALTEFIGTILMSAYVKGGKRLSSIIISLPDTGKTETLMQYKGNEGVYFLSDCTAFGVIRFLLADIRSGKIKHIVIPDFLKILQRKPAVANELISLLNSLSEEGFIGSFTFNIQIFVDQPIICGFITALTTDEYDKIKKRWKKIGFSSRIVPFFFGYNSEDLQKAFNDILFGRNPFHQIALPIPSLPQEVSISDTHRLEIGKIAKFAGKINNDFTVFRTIRNMLTFVKAHALLKGRTQVTDEDVAFLRSLIPFWFCPIVGNDCDYYIIRTLPTKAPQIVQKLKGIYSKSLIYERLKELETKGVIKKDKNGVWHTNY